MDQKNQPIEIVPATEAHIHDLGWIHVQSWRETYEGQIPASYLAGLDVTKRSLIWGKIIRDLDDKAGVYLIKFSDDQQWAGFVSFGEGRGEELKDQGEIYAIYLTQEFKNKGLGKKLLDAGVEKLKLAGYNKIGFWVLDTNLPAIAFYAASGAVDSGMFRTIEIGGVTLKESLMILESPKQLGS